MGSQDIPAKTGEGQIDLSPEHHLKGFAEPFGVEGWKRPSGDEQAAGEPLPDEVRNPECVPAQSHHRINPHDIRLIGVKSLLDLLDGVHHEWTIGNDWFFERRAGDQHKAHLLVLGLDCDAVAVAEFDQCYSFHSFARKNAFAFEDIGESGVPGVEYYTIRMNNINGAHIYGQLAKPAGAGKYPAMLIMQWASPPYPLQKDWITSHAAKGWLVLNVEPHDVPSNLSPEFYANLPTLIKNYSMIGRLDRDESYFLPMYLGDYRAVEYLAGRPDWDGKTLVATGTSMGGQQGFAVTGLNPKVTAMVIEVPAGADVTGPLHGRMAPYPNWDISRPEILTTARYFDSVNFSYNIKVPSLIALGFIDEACPPAGIYAAFNLIQAPKEAAPMISSPHNHMATPEQLLPWTQRSAAWFDALVHGQQPWATATGAAASTK